MGGHTCGFNWAGKPNERLKELSIMGFGVRLIAEILSGEFNYEVTIKMVEQAKYRLGAHHFMLEHDKSIKVFKELSLPMDNYMVSCDYHAPYHNEMWINLLLAVAEKFGVRKNIVIGDLFEFHFIMHHYTELSRSLDKEVMQVQPVINTLEYFDMNYVVQGNHENRVGRGTNGLIQAKHLFKLFGGDAWEKKFKYSTYDKLNIGDDWMVVHPGSYSQVSGSVAVRLAEKFVKNVINSHGHFVAMRYTRDGKHRGIDLGGMFDRSRVDYINLKTTTHPIWNNGFGMMYNGHFYHFHDGTDWDWWLGNK